MPGPLILGIPLWAWIVGGGGAVVGGAAVGVATNTVDDMGDAVEKVGVTTDKITKLVLITGGAYIAYQASKVLK